RAAAKHVLRSRPLAALRHGPSLDLHDVEREVEHGRVGNRRPDAVGIDHGVEMQDLVLVHSARRDDLHVAIAADIELPPHFLDDAEEVAAPGRRRIEADGVEITRRSPAAFLQRAALVAMPEAWQIRPSRAVSYRAHST